jgi:AcrR family transcriptional regulator
MKEKDLVIINEAMKLFALKGYSSTSIQEIASKSGISKGAFYLHFKSKDALLLAILNHYYERLKKEVFSLEKKSLHPREKFQKQLTVFFKNLLEHKDFIIMISREQAFPLNEATKKTFYKMHLETLDFYKRGLFSIYGQHSEPYLWDLSISIEGLIHSFSRIFLFDNQPFNLEALADYLLKRVDSIYHDLTQEAPLLSQAYMEKILFKTKIFMSKETEHINTLLSKMRNELENTGNKKDLEVTIEVLEAEFSRDNPRVAVIQGMLSNFSGMANFENYVRELSAVFQLSLEK